MKVIELVGLVEKEVMVLFGYERVNFVMVPVRAV